MDQLGRATGRGSVSLGSALASGQFSVGAGGPSTNATAFYSAALGGQNITITGVGDGSVGGQNNNLSGTDSFIGAGQQANDRGRYNSCVFAAGDFAIQGDAQTACFVLRGSGSSTGAIRLTGDQSAAGSANCVNIPNNTGHLLNIQVLAFDHTTITKNEAWANWAGLLTRGANAASTAIVMASTPTPLSNGTVTGSSIASTADTANGCLNLSFTPPSGNTDTWNVVAYVRTVEAQ